jgi:hypothetical protein
MWIMSSSDRVRTTLDIDADVLEIAKGMAQGRKISVGKALSDLARRGARTLVPLIEKSGVYVIPREVEGGSFGPADVQNALESEPLNALRSFRKPHAK